MKRPTPREKPWRKVVRTERAKSLHTIIRRNVLECGHVLTYKGEKAWDADLAKFRRCAQCADAGREGL